MTYLEQTLASALASAVNYAGSQMCLHDETHRAGAIWNVCDQCGAKWADDELKPLPKQPPWFPMATYALAEYERQQSLEQNRINY